MPVTRRLCGDRRDGSPASLSRRLTIRHTFLVVCGVPLQAIAADVEAGRNSTKPTCVFRFEEIQAAHRVMESNEAKGKVVVIL
jgi:NADPH:quinone reductase-like Zn-dependent oxidoreductase